MMEEECEETLRFSPEPSAEGSSIDQGYQIKRGGFLLDGEEEDENERAEEEEPIDEELLEAAENELQEEKDKLTTDEGDSPNAPVPRQGRIAARRPVVNRSSRGLGRTMQGRVQRGDVKRGIFNRLGPGEAVRLRGRGRVQQNGHTVWERMGGGPDLRGDLARRKSFANAFPQDIGQPPWSDPVEEKYQRYIEMERMRPRPLFEDNFHFQGDDRRFEGERSFESDVFWGSDRRADSHWGNQQPINDPWGLNESPGRYRYDDRNLPVSYDEPRPLFDERNTLDRPPYDRPSGPRDRPLFDGPPNPRDRPPFDGPPDPRDRPPFEGPPGPRDRLSYAQGSRARPPFNGPPGPHDISPFEGPPGPRGRPFEGPGPRDRSFEGPPGPRDIPFEGPPGPRDIPFEGPPGPRDRSFEGPHGPRDRPFEGPSVPRDRPFDGPQGIRERPFSNHHEQHPFDNPNERQQFDNRDNRRPPFETRRGPRAFEERSPQFNGPNRIGDRLGPRQYDEAQQPNPFRDQRYPQEGNLDNWQQDEQAYKNIPQQAEQMSREEFFGIPQNESPSSRRDNATKSSRNEPHPTHVQDNLVSGAQHDSCQPNSEYQVAVIHKFSTKKFSDEEAALIRSLLLADIMRVAEAGLQDPSQPKLKFLKSGLNEDGIYSICAEDEPTFRWLLRWQPPPLRSDKIHKVYILRVVRMKSMKFCNKVGILLDKSVKCDSLFDKLSQRYCNSQIPFSDWRIVSQTFQSGNKYLIFAVDDYSINMLEKMRWSLQVDNLNVVVHNLK